MRSLAFLLLCIFGVSACGQRGPLFLPEGSPAVSSSAPVQAAEQRIEDDMHDEKDDKKQEEQHEHKR